MKVQRLQNVNAFSPGSEVWALPDLQQSKWTRQVDWYLNFVLTRAKQHNTSQHSPSLQKIISENELPFSEPKPANTDFYLLGSQNRLPNHQTVIIPFHEDVHNWVQKTHAVWQNLKNPKTRIFLPLELSDDDFQQHWPNSSSDSTIELVNHLN